MVVDAEGREGGLLGRKQARALVSDGAPTGRSFQVLGVAARGQRIAVTRRVETAAGMRVELVEVHRSTGKRRLWKRLVQPPTSETDAQRTAADLEQLTPPVFDADGDLVVGCYGAHPRLYAFRPGRTALVRRLDSSVQPVSVAVTSGRTFVVDGDPAPGEQRLVRRTPAPSA